MQKQENNRQSQAGAILAQPGTPPIFIDLFNFSKNPENTILTISASYALDGVIDEQPGVRFVEHSRHAITIDHAKRTLDVLARMLNYYPQKPETPPPVKEEAQKNKK